MNGNFYLINGAFALQKGGITDCKNYNVERVQWLSFTWNIVCITLADLLWTAPELLRERQLRPSSSGSQKRSEPYLKTLNLQKCDVYSFAIILQEFHTRRGPYSNNSNLATRGTSTDIFDRLRAVRPFCLVCRAR